MLARGMPSVLHTASMIFRKFYDEYVTKKDPAGRRGRVVRLKMTTAKKAVTERAACRSKREPASPLQLADLS